MGMFDDVTSTDPRFRCRAGHLLVEMQTKSFACVLGTIDIFEDGRMSFGETHLGPVVQPGDRPFSGVAVTYTICDRCEEAGLDGAEAWTEFEVLIVDDRVTSVVDVASGRGSR